MQLGVTFPLQRKLGLRNLPYGEPENRLCCWDLHCILLHGRDSLLAVHCSSRFTVTAFDVSRADWLRLPEFAADQIERGLLTGGLPRDAVERYLRQAGACCLTRTHGRREVAFLNRAWNDVLAFDYAWQPGQQEQPLLNRAVNAAPCRCAGADGQATAAQFLQRDFAAFL